ncbi:MAG TPA: DUF2182 domain-containing protein [Rhodopseudomonas sp.]|uniref:DUF2182 domain-containing protein n=1 Tax=Rhodopseudomonas sp. TaxID=1078 RepID=UPI002ED9849D
MKPGGVALALVRRQSPALLAASAAGWAALLAFDHAMLLPALCGASAGGADRLAATLALNPPGLLMLVWIAMLLAMMPPLLTQPIAHLRQRSLARRRWRALAVFAAGYALVWCCAGAVLIASALALSLLQTVSGVPAWGFALMLALLWQFSPAKQLCLNRCHRLSRLSAFGLRAELDCLRYGAVHGVWCVGSCWALMLLPLTAGAAHLAVMAAASPALLLERTCAPRPAHWALARPRWLARPRLFPRTTLRARTAP